MLQIEDNWVQIPSKGLLFPSGSGTVHEMLWQPLDETEGAKPSIKLIGIIYRAEWASRTQA